MDEPIPIDRSSAANVGDVRDTELVEMMVAARRSASRMQALELAAVAELARRREAEDEVSGVGVLSPRDYLHDEVASALRVTATSADYLSRFATELTGRLPATFAALAAGDLDYARARTVWHATAQVDDEIAAQIEARLYPRAVDQTTGQIRAKIRRLVKRLDPDTLTRRRQDAERRRDVQLLPTDDGTAHLSGLDLPADAATAACNRLNAIAAALKTDGDPRALGQLRADVFLALLSGTLTTTQPPTDPTALPAVHGATRKDDDWTAIDDAVADAIAGATRTHISGLLDELPAGDARHRGLSDLIAQAGERIADSLADLRTRWCDAPPTADPGHSRDQADERAQWSDEQSGHGHDGYRVPARMRRLIEARDRRCGWPGCRRPVSHCDADHTVPYHRRGPTCPCNLAMLCRRHHTVKQSPGWRLQQPWPGVLLWITPTGHWRITAPPDRE
jgi:hypothetical protein